MSISLDVTSLSDQRSTIEPQETLRSLLKHYEMTSSNPLRIDWYGLYFLGNTFDCKEQMELNGAFISQLAFSQPITVVVECPSLELKDREEFLKTFSIPSFLKKNIYFYNLKYERALLLPKFKQKLLWQKLYQQERKVNQLRITRGQGDSLPFLKLLGNHISKELQVIEKDLKNYFVCLVEDPRKSLCVHLETINSQHPTSKVLFIADPIYFEGLEVLSSNTVSLIPKSRVDL